MIKVTAGQEGKAQDAQVARQESLGMPAKACINLALADKHHMS